MKENNQSVKSIHWSYFQSYKKKKKSAIQSIHLILSLTPICLSTMELCFSQPCLLYHLEYMFDRNDFLFFSLYKSYDLHFYLKPF